MSLTNDVVMPVSPMYGNGGFGGGFGGDGAWWLLILLFALGGWNGGFGGYGGNGAEIQSGFNQNAIMTGITGLNGAINDVAGAICAGFANTEVAANARQMADMQQMFALQSQMAQCCCDNRAATADLKYTVATEACADRAAISNALRDVIESSNANTQRILDLICQNTIESKNERISDLERQLSMASLAASQTAQTATLENFIRDNVVAAA